MSSLIDENEMKKFILDKTALLPEFLGGLEYLVEGEEESDLTCAAIKRASGKREKGTIGETLKGESVWSRR